MTSNMLSRLMQISNTASPSVYEEMQREDAGWNTAASGTANFDPNEEFLATQYHDDEALLDAMDNLQRERARFQHGSLAQSSAKAGRSKYGQHGAETSSGDDDYADEADDDVPPSLLAESDKAISMHDLPPRPSEMHEHVININDHQHGRDANNPERGYRPHLRWNDKKAAASPVPPVVGAGLAGVDPKEMALWRWANVANLDNFLLEVYTYFLKNGIWSICLHRVLNLLTLAFVVGFTTFLTSCIDYRAIPHSKSMPEVLIPKCAKNLGGWSSFLLWLFTLFWIGKAFQYTLDIANLRRMHDFYFYLLGVSDADIQTISWQEIVSRLMTLRDLHPTAAPAVSAENRKYIGSQSKQRMDAHDIANRLMRRENYLIALFNKDILDLTLPLPFLRNHQLFSRTLEWNLNICILDFVFNEQGQVRPMFLKETNRRLLSEALRKRFIIVGVLNIIIAPFLVTYFLMHYFFRYFNEYQKNPALFGSRQYTPLAEWKFREFNELWHLFQRRINMSYPFANRYIDQFPKDKTVQVCRFVAFIAGALASVLALASVIDPELFLGFEITKDRTVLFYLGLFGSVWAAARGLVPEKTLVFDPEFALREVIDYTRYLPSHWHGKLHSDEVKTEFAQLYQMKVVIFLTEILSMIFTPFVLCFSLPHCSDRVIDFFREFTVHVDGLGYLCSFAEFNFQKGSNALPSRKGGKKTDPRSSYFATKDNKMLASYFGFLDNYGDDKLFPPSHAAAMPQPATHLYPYPSSLARDQHSSRLATSHLRNRMHDPLAHPAQNRQPHTSGSPRPFPAEAGPAASDVLTHSALLDPHHQPSRVLPLSNSHMPRYRRSPLHQAHASSDFAEQAEDDTNDGRDKNDISKSDRKENEPPSPRNKPAATSSDIKADESWRSALDEEGRAGNEDEAADNDIQALVEGPGVLGLVKQLQGAGNETRTGGRGSIPI